MSSSTTDPDELRVLDLRGCLTPEVMCFTSELSPEQRAVVERHVRSCVRCAQHQTILARTADRVRRARPPLSLLPDVKYLASRAALREVSRHRPSRILARLLGRSSGLGSLRTPGAALWLPALIASLAALLMILIGALLIY